MPQPAYTMDPSYWLEERHTNADRGGWVIRLGRTGGDACNFGPECKISMVEDIAGNLVANVLPDLAKRLNEIRTLPDNWDGRGTAAPNQIAYLHAWDVIGVLSEMNLAPAKLMPSADEGIGFYFSNKNKYGFVECYNDGEIVVAMSDRKGYRKIKQIGDAIDEIKDELENLKVFINAS